MRLGDGEAEPSEAGAMAGAGGGLLDGDGQARRLGGRLGSRRPLHLDHHVRLLPRHRTPLDGTDVAVHDRVRHVRCPRQPSRVVVDEHHRAARGPALQHRPLQLRTGGRVEAGPGLVEDEEFRFGEQGLGDHDLLAAALGQLRHRRTGVLGGAQAFQPLDGGPGGLPTGQAVDAAEVDQIAGRGEGKGGREAFGDVRGAGAARDTALGGRVDPGEQPQQGRLAGAVGTLDPRQGARGQREVDAAQHPWGAAETVPAADALQQQLAIHAPHPRADVRVGA
ncbi:hypothetical protein GCM10010306_052830 [Streptomyces umbrinus]|nr:hypothetical protein GCM10010306_052830 [Streptomyces umbrinus]